MSEHIKTGEEIDDEINSCDDETLEILYKEKYVSLSWLKEQVQKKYDESYNLQGILLRAMDQPHRVTQKAKRGYAKDGYTDFYYTKSDRAIEEIAEKIYAIVEGKS